MAFPYYCPPQPYPQPPHSSGPPPSHPPTPYPTLDGGIAPPSTSYPSLVDLQVVDFNLDEYLSLENYPELDGNVNAGGGGGGGGEDWTLSLPELDGNGNADGGGGGGGGEDWTLSLPELDGNGGGGGGGGGGEDWTLSLPELDGNGGGGGDWTLSLPELDGNGGGGGGGGGEDWTLRLPPGVKFRPTDEELLVHYLKPLFLHGYSGPSGPIAFADIYDYEPHQLTDLAYDHGDGKMYFFTVIKKIGKSKTDRSITSKKGNWKPTQAPTAVRGEKGIAIGNKTPLAYYEGKRKTQWLMQEFKLSSHTSHHSSQELVLAVIYYHHRRRRGDNDN